jgi:hypothetical protein
MRMRAAADGNQTMAKNSFRKMNTANGFEMN